MNRWPVAGLVIAGAAVCPWGHPPATTAVPPAAVAPPPRLAGTNARPGYSAVALQRGPFTDWWYVNVRINGKTAGLMVDTGAPVSVINAHCADRFGYTPDGPSQVFELSGGGTAEYRQSVRPTLDVGSVTTSAVRFQIMSAPLLRPSFIGDGRDASDGILGASFLHAYGAVIDYPAATLHFRDPLAAEHVLQGRWRCVAREHAAETEPKERVAHIRLRVRGESATIEVGANDFTYRLGLDPSAAPKRMDLVDKDDYAVPMIYKVEDGRLTIAAALFQPRAKVKSRPASFRTKAGDDLTVLTFEKEP